MSVVMERVYISSNSSNRGEDSSVVRAPDS